MAEALLQQKSPSPRPFDSLYEQYADFCRKLHFLIMSAFAMEEESLGLEIISEFLEQKEKELQELKISAGNRIEENSGSVELLLGRLLMEREDYRILQRIAEIRQNGGPRWEALQSLIREQTPDPLPHQRPAG
ncbi:MAG: hypothetical protein ACP5SH_04800 [Syntrophobacteraceae bacterium]